ncbi:hypothetical protein [Mesobacillus foraminis]|uniref:Uncharacterized protein n=1 Tax=Mesobacillus foraminis TaxID=279826 RepID=A0A4R2AV30_9BACI|nr:hypothetical protein [Mesobacillus foraminis]MBT2757479.1 hypothetical protein [Mesobacillus foraminis]TCN17616.1 hypothetical protein EV146_12444 [Mesobacillus foraminis]
MIEAKTFTVEYELASVVFYQQVQAKDMEEAKLMVRQQQSTANIRAVTLFNDEEII